MRWLCWFSPCRWIHVANVSHDAAGALNNFGLWQCSRCKTLSVGRSTEGEDYYNARAHQDAYPTL